MLFLGDAETGVYLFERTHNLTNHHKRGTGIKNSKSTVNRRKRYIYCDGLDRRILYCILFVFMLVLLCFCVATEFSANKDFYKTEVSLTKQK